MTYHYTASDPNACDPHIDGTINAHDAGEARNHLYDMGYCDVQVWTKPPAPPPDTITPRPPRTIRPGTDFTFAEPPTSPLVRIELARATAAGLANSVALTGRGLDFLHAVPRNETALYTLKRLREEIVYLDDIIQVALPGGVFARPIAEGGKMALITDHVLGLVADAAEEQLGKIETLVEELYEQI